jgi:hypothetical protein
MPLLPCRIARLLFEVGCVGIASGALLACGSTGSQPAPGIDGSSAGDAAQMVDDAGDRDHAVDANGQTDGGSIDGATGGVGDGGTWLDGSMAFGARYSLLVPQNLISCGYAPSPATGYGDFVVIMTDVDLSSGCDGGTFTGFPDAGAGHPFLRIEVKSPSYRSEGGALTMDGGPVAPIVPGVYPIGFDNWTGDVCMLTGTNGLALVDVMRFTDRSCCSILTGEALSGAVTLTTVDQGHVAGTFQIALAPRDGGIVTAAPLSGQFDTTTCPGTAQ